MFLTITRVLMFERHEKKIHAHAHTHTKLLLPTCVFVRVIEYILKCYFHRTLRYKLAY
jgi:hypothetical protein